MASRRRRRSARAARESLRAAQLSRGPYRTRTGKVLTDDDIEALAAEADLGYPAFRAAQSTGFALDVTVLRDRCATVARVGTPWGQAETGSAKREPGDPDDPEIAVFLSVGRALSELGAALQARGSELVIAAELEARAAKQAAITERIKRSERRALQRNHPQHHFMGTQRIHEEYGYEAALRHEARKLARENGTDWALELETLVRERREREEAAVAAEQAVTPQVQARQGTRKAQRDGQGKFAKTTDLTRKAAARA